MRASLASATSLLALLLGTRGVFATPSITTGQSTLSFGDVLVGGTTKTLSSVSVATVTSGSATTLSITTPSSPFGGSTLSGSITSNSASSFSSNFTFAPLSTGAATAQTQTATISDSGGGTPVLVTLSGTGVAPLEAITTSNPYLLVGSVGTINLAVANIGNGNLSNVGTTSNLRGTVGSASSVFSGGGVAFSLADTTSTSAAATTQTFAYTYTPTTKGVVSSGTVVTTFNNGTNNNNTGTINNTNSSGSVTTTLSATGVAPVGVISTTSSTYVLVGQTGTSSVTVSNTGNGNLSGLGTVSNLRGSISSSGTGFTGSTTNFSLGDSTQTVNPTSTVANFSFAPTVKGATASALVVASLSNGTGLTNSSSSTNYSLTGTGVAPIASVSNNGTVIGRIGTAMTSIVTIANTGNGNQSGLGSISNLNGVVSNALGLGVSAAGGNASSVSLADAATSTLSYSYTPISRGTVSSTATVAFSDGNSAGTNTSQTISSVFVNQAVGPTYNSSISGAGATNTPTAVANGSVGSASKTISFGTVGFKNSVTVYLDLLNTTQDPGTALQTDLTIDKYSIAGTGASSFSPSLTFGSVVTEGGQLLVPITVTNTTGYGVLNSSLTIFTDESAALGGTGDTFTYALTALAVPEPASILVLGAGLAGLAGLRRRRRLG